ncbi:hypothetical protein PMIN04_003633 [Paraphaeosphaeria minitans]
MTEIPHLPPAMASLTTPTSTDLTQRKQKAGQPSPPLPSQLAPLSSPKPPSHPRSRFRHSTRLPTFLLRRPLLAHPNPHPQSHRPRPQCLPRRHEFAMSDENTWGDVEHAHGAHASDVLKAFHTNAVGAHLGLHTALLNHSCRPNAYAGFKEGTGEVRVYALRDILEGEQICISHLEGSAFSEAMGLRRGILVLQRGFVCLCDACMDAEESANMEREARDENLRATLQWLIAKYRWNEARLIDNFGMKGHKGVDPGFAMFLVEVGEGIVEVLEKLGMATMETLEWHQKIIHWSLALRENKMADDWREKMLQVVRICVGEGSVMYCEMQREEIGANAVERENTTTDVSRMGHPKVMMADEPEVEDEDKEIPWGTYDESSEEEDNSKDEDYVN